MKFSKKYVYLILLIGTIIIPLLYSFFYLGAFWDPYSKLDKIPIALINCDKGTTFDGKDKNYGKEMCDNLIKDGTFKFTETSEKTGEKGTKGNDYYAYIKIPENFSESIASAQSDTKQLAEVTFSPNEKRNYLASQILNRAILEIQSSLQNNVNKEIIGQLTAKLNSMPEQLSTLSQGLGQLNTGATNLNEGTNKLGSGTNDLSAGAKKLDTGVDQLLAGINQLDQKTTDLAQLKTSIQQLSAGATQLNTSLQAYTSGVSTLINNVNSTATFLQTYCTAHHELLADPTFARFISNLGSTENRANIQKLSAATTQLQAGSAQISAGLNKLANSTANITQLREGILQLQAGLKAAKQGSAALSSGSAQLNSGVTSVNSGTTALQNGLNKALQSVNASISDGKVQLTSLNGLDTFASDKVKINQKTIDAVPNYGTAFAPYFLSLSMWVGALIIFFGIYFDVDSRFKLLSRQSDDKIKRSFCYLLISTVQAIVLGVVLIFALGLKVNNVPLYFMSCILISLVFIAIVQFLIVMCNDVGKFLCILLLILQLTSCGGTFPMQTVPKLYNILYPFMPMTYSVGLLKESISGPDAGQVVFNSLILLAILVVFMALTIAAAIYKKKKSLKLNMN